MHTIFDEINATEVGSYWTTLAQNTEPYLWETLMPTKKQIGANFKFYRGKSRSTRPLAPSAFGVPAIMRSRAGYQEINDKTRYFKEGDYIDEDLRQELLRVGENGSQAEKDLIMNHVFDDSLELVSAASLTREIMRNQMIQTGKVNVFGNGQLITADYGMKDTHRVVADKAWGAAGSTPLEDIRKAKYVVKKDSNQTITRAAMNQKTFDTLLSDSNIKSTILNTTSNIDRVTMTNQQAMSYILINYGVNIQVYDKTYTDIDGVDKYWIPDGRVIFMPDGDLGYTRMSLTPEEADLRGNVATDVSIVDEGVAITSTLTSDPVNKKINVSQMVLPSFEQIDGVYILDTAGATAKDPTDLETSATVTTPVTDPKA